MLTPGSRSRRPCMPPAAMTKPGKPSVTRATGCFRGPRRSSTLFGARASSTTSPSTPGPSPWPVCGKLLHKTTLAARQAVSCDNLALMLSSSGPAPLEAGKLIGRKYRLVRRLAIGGMGEVWVARNDTTDALVAMKLLHRAESNQDALARFRHEAKLGAMLVHRSIVRVFDLLEEPDGALVLVMELLRGESLERWLLRQGTLSCKEAVAIAVPLLSALAHAHACGVVHRDVTPANIFLSVDPDGLVTPKLVDFGIAKVSASGIRTLDGRVLGTPRYMSPEQIRADDIDGRSDLFSLAVVAYEVITGACPFAANSPSASLAAVIETPVDPDPRIEPRLWLELQRALSKRAYERHRDATEMAAALCTALGETESALATSLRRPPPPRELDAAEPAANGVRTRSVGGHSYGYSGAMARRRATWTSWLVGGALIACVALLATAAWR